MAVKIRLKRLGKVHAPYYRIVVADSRTRRDGRVIEEIGKYHPKSDPSFIEVDSERAQYWLRVGAQPSEPVAAILKLTGDWQRFKGEPVPEGALRMPESRRDKTEAFNAALKEAHDEPEAEAVTGRRRSRKPADTPAEPATPSADILPPNAIPADEAVPPEVSAGEVDTSVEVSAETKDEPSPDDFPAGPPASGQPAPDDPEA